jgi:hypothetical protein
MSVQETSEIRELTADEINDVSGGFWWLLLLRQLKNDVPDLSEGLTASASR